MATFPDYEPDQRSYEPGDGQLTIDRHRSGTEYRVRRGAALTSDRLRLTYQERTAAEVAAFIDHYETQEGGFLGFPLSSQAVLGYGAEALAASNLLWHYRRAPQIEANAGGLQTVTVELEAYG